MKLFEILACYCYIHCEKYHVTYWLGTECGALIDGSINDIFSVCFSTKTSSVFNFFSCDFLTESVFPLKLSVVDGFKTVDTSVSLLIEPSTEILRSEEREFINVPVLESISADKYVVAVDAEFW